VTVAIGFSWSRNWVYPEAIRGRFQRTHQWTSLVLHLFLFLMPWVNIRGQPAFSIDLPARRLYLLGGIFTAADGVLIMLIALLAAFGLFFFTSLYGRLWCGYACPQSVFLIQWVLPIERWLEGSRGRQMRRDQGPLTFDKAWRKLAKWALLLGLAFLVSMAFMGFFSDTRALWTGRGGPVQYALVVFFALVWFADFSWFREQFCNYLCPYARFQSVLMDDASLLPMYDRVRGEPRGKGSAAAAENRCISCGKCVRVCPQGIDIRDGFQLECIACARCVDACTDVYDKLGGKTLVLYTTLAEANGEPKPENRFRPVLYGGLLAILLASMVGVLLSRPAFQLMVERAPGTLFTIDRDGLVRNTYLVQITDVRPSPDEVRYDLSLEGLDNVEVSVPEVALKGNESRTFPLVVRMPRSAEMPRTIPFQVRVASGTGKVERQAATFKTPGPLEP